MDIHHENVVPNSDIGIRFFESIVDTSGFLPFHWHSSIELVYVMSGRLDMQFNGKTHTIEANQFMAVSSGVVHSVANTPNQALVLQVPLKFVERYYLQANHANFVINKANNEKAYSEVLKLLNELNIVNKQKKQGYLFEYGALVLLILKELFTNFNDIKHPLNENTNLLKDVIIYININYNNQLNISDLSKRFGYNASYLSRKFKQQMGITIVEYIYMVRLSNLYTDLIETPTPISLLMDKHGLKNRRTAREMCQKMYGLLPKQIRQKHKKSTGSN
ncbi:AraC family transcriptional regulator [Liquorilactobacillus nagelii]|jgi:AraC-like DNA-binding protein|uniref:AraC family transcriptional regulator n=1 Tax=Liquorilactobacillus nagelii TaxID=82688 RepID=UPI00242FA1B4|nr:AraC family transcriptional regulator [Liquorilactobacillus nagelii]MCI1632543.1 AraC family transcriptional regulator [Liquorilactobacillus nagelii]